MSRYIDADMLREKMYHEAFEKDSQDQKWDSGCWIRYRMFENAVDSIPTADVVEVVRCKDCKWGDRHGTTDEGKPYYYCVITDWAGQPPEFFCANGEREEKTDDK